MFGIIWIKVLEMAGIGHEKPKATVVAGPSAPKVGASERHPVLGGYNERDLK